MTPLIVSVKEAAAALGVSAWVVRRYVADGLLATVQFPSTRHRGETTRRILIAVADLEAFVLKHREVVR
jgi:hypothetical protein